MVLSSLTRAFAVATAARVARPHHATTLSSLASASASISASALSSTSASASMGLPAALLAAASRAMSSGSLLPDGLVSAMLDARLEFDDTRYGWVLDGYPRNVSQAVSLCESSRRPEVAIVLETSDAAASARMLSRRVDPETGRTYNVLVDRPSTHHTTTSAVSMRADDHPDAVAARLLHYRQVAPDVEQALMSSGVELIRIDGSARPNVVAHSIATALDLTPRASRFLILGPPGSGKGTQAVHIARRAAVPHVSTGHLLRQACQPVSSNLPSSDGVRSTHARLTFST